MSDPFLPIATVFTCSLFPPPLNTLAKHTKLYISVRAGGGGSKSETRKARIFEKNTKLSEERARAAKEALKQKKKTDATKPADDSEVAAPVKNDLDDVHPSRRGWVPGA